MALLEGDWVKNKTDVIIRAWIGYKKKQTNKKCRSTSIIKKKRKKSLVKLNIPQTRAETLPPSTAHPERRRSIPAGR